MITVAIYARHSTDKQAHSTQDQIARCKMFCKQSGYDVAGVYCDEAISGAFVSSLTGINELMADALCGDFNRIVAEDLSRFSRDQGDISHFYRKMRYLDIDLETVAEGNINELHIGLKGTMNALYIRDLADKTHRGMIASVLKGRVPGGGVYGYNVVHKMGVNGEPIRGLRRINEEETRVVRFIFRQYESGVSANRICTMLNKQGIPAPKGKAWGPATLTGQYAKRTGLLRQTFYKGVVTFNRMMYRKNPDTGRRTAQLRPEKDWIRVTVPELAIMDEQTFNHVQDMIEERSRVRHNHKLLNNVLRDDEKSARKVIREKARRTAVRKDRLHATYLITGKLWCSHHKIAMIASRKKLYSCPIKGCHNRNLWLDRDLMPPVLDTLATFSSNDITDWTDSQATDCIHYCDKAHSLESSLADARNGVSNVLDAMAQQRKTAETVTWIREQERKIRRLEYDLAETRNNLHLVSPLNDQETNTVLKKFREALEPVKIAADINSFDQDATLKVRSWIDKIAIIAKWDNTNETWQRRANIRYNWPRLLKDTRD